VELLLANICKVTIRFGEKTKSVGYSILQN